MEELVVPQINAYMGGSLLVSLKEYQVTRPHVALGYGSTHRVLFCGCSGHADTIFTVYILDESGTIKA